jgi:nucleoside-diphosphate-sugar epimerase
VTIVEAPGSVVGGQMFNITDDTDVTILELQTLFAKAAGRKEEDLKYEETSECPYEFMFYSLLAVEHMLRL